MRMAIVTDTTAYIPDALLNQYDIHTIPLSVSIEEHSYREGIDITSKQFYEKVRSSQKLPSTSQPSIGAFVELYEKLAKNYDGIISIHLSKKISGTYNAAVSARKMVEEVEVYPFDSAYSAMAQGFYVLAAAEMAKEGYSPNDILARLQDMRAKTKAYFMVDDLNHLQKGGRLTNAQAILGSLLHIKPLLYLPDGEIKPYEKIRTRKKAIKRIMSMLDDAATKQEIAQVSFIHANDESSAKELQSAFQIKHPEIESIVSCFGPVLGTHLGEGALGATWYTT